MAYLMAVFSYTIAPLSYAGSIREVSVVFGALAGWWFLKEKMGGFRGIVVIAVFG